ncbi:MAG: DUF1566 domain-containing protein [Leptospirales bacterium]|nr:DUF1566 domain-containing protein [Leptospirales bacterium]
MKSIYKISMSLLIAAFSLLTACEISTGNGEDGYRYGHVPATDAHIHNWGGWEIITPPTCTEPGEEMRTCDDDPSHIETRSVAALGHDWGGWESTATCTVSGVETRICANDSSHIETHPVAALGHDWGGWATTTSPTCTVPGVETRTCANDPSHTETNSVPALGHDYNLETGLCNRCGDLYYNLGDTGPGGGIIFYIAPNGFDVEGHPSFSDNSYTAHYLEAAPEDMPSTLPWAVSPFDGDPVPGDATATAIGAGRRNTALIVEQNGPGIGFDAGACVEYFVPGYESYGDWFLPSKDELNLLFINRSYVGSFGNFYWSSSEYSIDSAWVQAFSSGNQNASIKNNTDNVRAVRAF